MDQQGFILGNIIMAGLMYIDLIQGPNTDPFIIAVNTDIKKLNELIHTYNHCADNKAQLALLKDIFLCKQRMDNTYSDNYISRYTDYQEQIQKKLFKQIQLEAKNHGIYSMYHSEYLTNVPLDSFPIILANMEPEKINLLLQILSAGCGFEKDKLTNLYSPSEPGYQDY